MQLSWKMQYLSCAVAPLSFHLLQSFGIKATERVGIIGIGGLGHLAMQFAKKMGCEVVAISTSDRKKEEAMQLGAGEFVVTAGTGRSRSASLSITWSSQPLHSQTGVYFWTSWLLEEASSYHSQ
jgi:D-arabinose 1-dehydrogenase-like Zn-dependent alcohol dehydrogenase